MIVLVAHYYCKPGEVDAVLETLRKMKPLVEAHEPDCVFYQASRSQEDPNHLMLYEHYVDEAALLGHRETPFFKQYIEGEIIPRLEKRVREFYTLEIE